MRNYEVVFIAAPVLTNEELDNFINHIRAVIESKNGNLARVDSWGKKPLAYRIKKYRDGYYVVLTVEGDGAAIAEIERRFRVTDFIMRFISIRVDQDLKRAEKLKAARQKKLPAAKTADSQTKTESEAAPH